MPVTLSTSFDPGSFDPGKTYGKIKVVEFILDLYRSEIRLTIGRGYVDGDEWIWARNSAGMLITTEHKIKNIPETLPALDENSDPIPDTGSPADPQFDIMISKMGDSAKTVYDKAAEELYVWVIANVTDYSGTQDP